MLEISPFVAYPVAVLIGFLLGVLACVSTFHEYRKEIERTKWQLSNAEDSRKTARDGEDTWRRSFSKKDIECMAKNSELRLLKDNLQKIGQLAIDCGVQFEMTAYDVPEEEETDGDT